MQKRTGVLILLLGLLLGPGYYVYARFFSGELVASQVLEIDGKHFAPIALSLDPNMGAIGLVLRFSVSHGPTPVPPDTPRSDYRVRVFEGERVILEQTFSLQSSEVESTPGRQFQRALPVLYVNHPGVYHLELAAQGEPGMRVHSADLQVRAHVREPDLRLLVAGGVMVAIGLATVLF